MTDILSAQRRPDLVPDLAPAPPSIGDLPVSYAPAAVFPDWDRTMGSVEPAVRRLVAVTERYGADVAQAQHEYAASQQDGGSHSPLRAVSRALEQRYRSLSSEERKAGGWKSFGDYFASFTRDYVEYVALPGEPDESLVYTDTPVFLGRVDQANAPLVVPTYGVDALWQRGFKLGGSHFTGQAEVLDTPDKAGYVSGLRSGSGMWDFIVEERDEAGLYVPTGIVKAETAVIIDDKPEAFQNLPSNCEGILVRRPGEKLQPGEWPADRTVSSLGQLIMVNGRVVRLPYEVVPPAYAQPLPQFRRRYVPLPGGVEAALARGDLRF